MSVGSFKAMRRGCEYCEGEPEPGWIEMPNNGPIVECPFCNPAIFAVAHGETEDEVIAQNCDSARVED